MRYPECKDSKILEPMTVFPTIEQWNDITSYVIMLESLGAHIPGIVKIRAPDGWDVDSLPKSERYNPSTMKDIDVGRPLKQTMKPSATSGAFETTAIQMPPLSVEKYVKLATSERHVTPPHQSYEELEDIYWNTKDLDNCDDPIYGADVPADRISINRVFKKDKTDMFSQIGAKVTMVKKSGSYLYFGMWKSTFSWHIEDMDLYANNYLHYGAPKNWYCVPPDQGYRLEAVARKLFPTWSNACYNFMRHKICMTHPKLLAKYGITVNKVVQEERDMIVVWPHAYHSGFNHGFNIAEASNFGTPKWIEYGMRYRPCMCADADRVVKVDMEPFIREYQPERLEAWKAGVDLGLHPTDSRELHDVWDFCQRIITEEISAENNVLDISASFEAISERKNENEVSEESDNEESETERKKYLKRLCNKQIQHLKYYRDIFPEIIDAMKQMCPSWMEETYDLIDEDEWEVEAIINKREANGETEYFVKWKDWNHEANTWEPLEHLGCHELIEEYEHSEKAKTFTISTKMLKRAAKCKVNVKKGKREEMKVHLERLSPVKAESPSKKAKRDSKKVEIVKKLGFADITAEQLEAKKKMTKCYFKHKFWNCTKCSGCIRPNCGKCWACKDKPMFGGKNIQKQKCQERKCSNPVVRGCDRCTWNI